MKKQLMPAGGCLMMVGLLCAGWVQPVQAQIDEDWVVFPDPLTDAQCGVVNASNAELIVLFDSGTMVKVNGPDVILEDLFVDANDQVFYFDEPAGFIRYAEDGDGLPAVFWVTLADTVVGIDSFTGEPFDSGLFPDERINTGCDACEFIDDSILCDDGPIGPPGPPGGGIDFPITFCGAGGPGAVIAGILAAPVLGLCSRRRRI